jgi:hypothetical protein
MVCLRNISVDTLHKGDSEDDNNNNNNNNNNMEFQSHLENKRAGNHEVKELQKTAILGTAHILRKVLT